MTTDQPGELPAPEIDPDELEEDETIDLRPPDVKGSRIPGGEFWKLRRRRKKRKKLVNKGYVQWFLVDDGWPEPRFVQPKAKGAGIPEVKHDGDRYLFPKQSMLPNTTQGMWTVIHRKGEADPINLRDPSKYAIPTDELDEYLNMTVSSSPPSWLGQFDLDAEDIIKYGIAAIIVFALVQGFLGGGF